MVQYVNNKIEKEVLVPVIEVSKEEHIILKIILEGEDATNFIQEITRLNTGLVDKDRIHYGTLRKLFQELKNI